MAEICASQLITRKGIGRDKAAPMLLALSVTMNLEEKFITLIDKVILEAELTKKSALASNSAWWVEECDLAIQNMLSLKSNVQAGKTPKSGGAGLGISRAFSEWDAPTNLYKAGYELDRFYMYEYNT